MIQRFMQWFLYRLRIFFFIGIFIFLYFYLAPVIAFGFVIYLLLNDLLEISLDIDELKKEEETLPKTFSPEKKRATSPIFTKRKGF